MINIKIGDSAYLSLALIYFLVVSLFEVGGINADTSTITLILLAAVAIAALVGFLPRIKAIG